MPPNDREKLNRIEELKNKLSNRDYDIKIEHRDIFTHSNRPNVPDVWMNGERVDVDAFNSSNKFFMKTSLFKKFFKFSLVFFILTLIYASYIFLAGGNTVSNDNIDISILGNNFVAGGEELPFVVGITNRNSSPLDLVDLVMEYPKSSSISQTDLSAGTERFRESLGTIPAGAVRNENLKVILFGEQGSVRPIKISLEYRVKGSNAIFVKEKNYEVTISSTPLNLVVDAPETISPNQDITFNVKTSLNATKPASNILLKFDYPVGFQFISANPSPTLGNNVWSLGDLAPGSERNVAISGRMIDVFDGEQKTFHISSGSQSVSDKSMLGIVFSSVAHVVTVKKPFIEAKLFVNGVYQREYAVDSKGTINAQIQWVNNLDTRVNDLSITAKISGNALNRRTISAQQGFYNSANDTIVWDKNYVSGFSEVNPGDSGSVGFNVSPLSLFSASGGMIADPSIKVEISISGKQLATGYETQNLINSDSSIIKIISNVGFNAKVLYYSGAFSNIGPIPPKVENETTYTINWSVSNTANNVSKAVARSSLPPWVRFMGTISPSSEDLTYNPSTREIVWNLGTIPKGAGITGADRSVSFQIAFSPSLSQVNTRPLLIRDTVLTGYDNFANVNVRANETSLNTTLDNDPSAPFGSGVVIE